MRLSNFKWKSFRIERNFDGKPYHLSFICQINETQCLFQIGKENSWEIHYIAHASDTCEHCGFVRLYSTCEVFSSSLVGKEESIFKWIRNHVIKN